MLRLFNYMFHVAMDYQFYSCVIFYYLNMPQFILFFICVPVKRASEQIPVWDSCYSKFQKIGISFLKLEVGNSYAKWQMTVMVNRYQRSLEGEEITWSKGGIQDGLQNSSLLNQGVREEYTQAKTVKCRKSWRVFQN